MTDELARSPISPTLRTNTCIHGGKHRQYTTRGRHPLTLLQRYEGIGNRLRYIVLYGSLTYGAPMSSTAHHSSTALRWLTKLLFHSTTNFAAPQILFFQSQ